MLVVEIWNFRLVINPEALSLLGGEVTKASTQAICICLDDKKV